ncbi:MAG TPA: serine hydrolase domain-containing protein [Polyangiaceae bacterium]|nr:serine hydrolase domain-containing protein [Polyangiaceae bacterium]
MADARAGAGAGGDAATASGAGGLADTPRAIGEAGDPAALSNCEAERAQLEQKMREALGAAVEDPSITSDPNLTLALETAEGYRFVYTHGDSSLEASYESASTSKWVAASIILDLVDRGKLKLSDEPSLYLPFWQAQGVTLAHLLSFTSGFSKEPLCLNLPNADFADCVQRAYEANVDIAAAPGSEFDYSSVHLQIAGLMAVRAAGAASFEELFAAWQAATGLFPSGAFDLPSRSNPRLAGGMHWTGTEYLAFLRAIYAGKLLRPETRAAMLMSERGDAKVAGSPVLEALGQDWAYGFGNWLECPTALGPDSFDCGSGHRNSSPGAYGAYPFIDFERHYMGILARQGELGTFRDGYALFSVIADEAARWASACQP